MCALVAVGAFAPGSAAPGETAPVTTTAITLTVTGCGGCKIQPVQNRLGDVSYWGPKRTVNKGVVRFTVPTRRTQQMAFLVYAPFDELANGGIPMVAVTRFLAKPVGSRVDAAFASTRRTASACWAGTANASFSNTLVVNRRHQGGKTVAGGYFVRTISALPYWKRVRGSAYHASDPSICK